MKRTFTLFLAVLMCLSLCACGGAAKQEEYEKAMTYLESGMLDNALAAFIELGNFNDSMAMVETINAYKNALELLENGELENAYLAFKELDGFYDSEEILEDFQFVQTSVDTYTDGKNTRSEEHEYNKDGSLSVTTIYELNGKKVNRYFKLYTYNNRDNSKTIETIYDGKTTIEEEYKYDSSGNETYYKLIASETNTYQWWYYYYDDAGNRIKSESYDIYDSSTPLYIQHMEYDEHNQLIRSYYVEDGKVTRETVYEYSYDESGNLIEERTGNSVTVMTYDEEGRVLSKVSYYKDEKNNETYYEYDEQGYVIAETRIERYSEEMTYTFAVTYNEDHTEATIEQFKNGEPNGITEETYNAAGQVLRSTAHDANGSWKHSQTWEYDAEGKLLQEGNFSSSETQADYMTIYTYDENGLLLSKNVDYYYGYLLEFTYEPFEILVRVN